MCCCCWCLRHSAPKWLCTTVVIWGIGSSRARGEQIVSIAGSAMHHVHSPSHSEPFCAVTAMLRHLPNQMAFLECCHPWNGSNGEWEGLLTLHIGGPAVLPVFPFIAMLLGIGWAVGLPNPDTEVCIETKPMQFFHHFNTVVRRT